MEVTNLAPNTRLFLEWDQTDRNAIRHITLRNSEVVFAPDGSLLASLHSKGHQCRSEFAVSGHKNFSDWHIRCTLKDSISKLDARDGEFECNAQYKLPHVIFN